MAVVFGAGSIGACAANPRPRVGVEYVMREPPAEAPRGRVGSAEPRVRLGEGPLGVAAQRLRVGSGPLGAP
jgi:hypothetical protein